jgi:hypothetical protein
MIPLHQWRFAMQAPKVYVVRQLDKAYAVHPLDSELMRFYPTEQEAIRHAIFILQWLGNYGEPEFTRLNNGELRISFNRSRQSTWDLSEL